MKTTGSTSLRLDHRNATPPHVPAAQLLRDLIRCPGYQTGEVLPDEGTLAAKLGMSRGTLRLAIGQRVRDGLLERRAGLCARVQPQRLSPALASFSLEMARKGIRVENYRQEFIKAAADEAAARALQIKPKTKIWRLDRVRGWDGEPVLHSRSWFHPRLCLAGREEFSKLRYEVIESETGLVAKKAWEEFPVLAANTTLAKLLTAKHGEPLLLRSHTRVRCRRTPDRIRASSLCQRALCADAGNSPRREMNFTEQPGSFWLRSRDRIRRRSKNALNSNHDNEIESTICFRTGCNPGPLGLSAPGGDAGRRSVA